MSDLTRVVDYHQATKHHLNRFARGPGRLDWATQPNPFRRYQGAPLLPLARVEPLQGPFYEPSFWLGQVEPRKLDYESVSQLFYDSLALSAWKRAGDVSWSLRVNPSSGNLHPTEGYLICGRVDGLTSSPLVAHYAPREHALEVRTQLPEQVWQALTAQLGEDTVLIGLSSIHWREAWKYGERAFRYCQHDVGHALAALTLAAAGLGWQAVLLDNLGTEQLAQLLGITDPQGAEAEHPDCLLTIYPQRRSAAPGALPENAFQAFTGLAWQGKPNLLSAGYREWPAVDGVAVATAKSATPSLRRRADREPKPLHPPASPGNVVQPSLRQVIRQRRSAVAMDPRGPLPRDRFYHILGKVLDRPGLFPFCALPWDPLVHLAIFVHRVEGLDPGLYFLLRQPSSRDALRSATRQGFLWETPGFCPPDLPLYLLALGDLRVLARQLSCNQDIASDGCFSLGMVASFEEPLREFGPWFYRRLFWECGMVGQILYLEAEATGLRGTGIGCFFDDAMHELLGLEGLRYQSLYHFTVGRPIEDHRLITLPAYPGS